MQRIVVTYWTGSDYDGGDVVLRLKYESTEALYVHLEEAVQKYLKEDEAYQAKMKVFQDKMKPVNDQWRKVYRSGKKSVQQQEKEDRVRKQLEEVREQYYPKEPGPHSQEVTLGTWKFRPGDFIRWDEKLKKSVVNMPTIQTLDEWFGEGDE
jgi:hypothetical protein